MQLPEPASMQRARYIMIGGFLGAGKTTLVARLAARLTARGQRVGLITNDQSSGLVDTALLRSQGFQVEEIAGGCFCCRFSSLSEAAERLAQDVRPDVFLAEPVGSCTDLVATVSYPLRRMYGERFTIAPLSVLLDPRRAARILGLAEGRSFSDKVVYVYKKQLEEAEFLLVNKCDTLADDERDALVAELGERFPRAEVFAVSAREDTGLDEWFERLLTVEYGESEPLVLDYGRYAEGEALLGWLNWTVRVACGAGTDVFDANRLLLDLAGGLRAGLLARDLEVAHLKMTLDAPEAGGQLAALSLTHHEDGIDLREALLDGVRSGELILNVRAEADPQELHAICLETLEKVARDSGDLHIDIEHQEHFRPAPPVPTYRMASAQRVKAGELTR